MRERQQLKQCKSCPWRVDCEPMEDIPGGYCVDLHKRLRNTIASSPVESLRSMLSSSCMRLMACHYSDKNKPTPCAGWIYNQLGPGNNIAVRLMVMDGRLPIPVVDGDQHDDFDDTLPRGHRPARLVMRGRRYTVVTRRRLGQDGAP